MEKTYKAMVALVLGSSIMMAGCDQADEGMEATEAMDYEVQGIEPEVELAPMATFSHADGLRFASEDAARAWTQEGPGVWLHGESNQRLVMGEEGHRWAAEQLQAELDALYASGADDSLIAAHEALLAGAQQAAGKAGEQASLAVSCNIATYNGGSSPFTGYTGGAALAQISCTGGTVVFTVQTQVCTGTYGCGPVNTQTAIPTSTPMLWGTARYGFGTCSSFVSLSPSGIYDSNVYTCS